jgi:hypothetical protein
MVSNHLADTRVRFLNGSAIVDVSTDPAANAAPVMKAPVTILYGDYQVRIAKDGLYRFNEAAGDLTVERGEAQVELDGNSTKVAAGFALNMEKRGLVARRSIGAIEDPLDDWNKARSNSIAQDNLEAANSGDLSGQIDNWQNDRDSYLEALGMSSYLPALPLSTYTPLIGSSMLGVTPMGLFGAGYGGLYGIYSYPYLRYYPGSVYGIYGYRPGTIVTPGRIRMPGGINTGIRPINPSIYGSGRPPAAVHIPAPVRAPAPMAHPGAVHVGGGRR